MNVVSFSQIILLCCTQPSFCYTQVKETMGGKTWENGESYHIQFIQFTNNRCLKCFVSFISSAGRNFRGTSFGELCLRGCWGYS